MVARSQPLSSSLMAAVPGVTKAVLEHVMGPSAPYVDDFERDLPSQNADLS